jgi:hypothetical protein
VCSRGELQISMATVFDSGLLSLDLIALSNIAQENHLREGGISS